MTSTEPSHSPVLRKAPNPVLVALMKALELNNYDVTGFDAAEKNCAVGDTHIKIHLNTGTDTPATIEFLIGSPVGTVCRPDEPANPSVRRLASQVAAIVAQSTDYRIDYVSSRSQQFAGPNLREKVTINYPDVNFRTDLGMLKEVHRRNCQLERAINDTPETVINNASEVHIERIDCTVGQPRLFEKRSNRQVLEGAFSGPATSYYLAPVTWSDRNLAYLSDLIGIGPVTRTELIGTHPTSDPTQNFTPQVGYQIEELYSDIADGIVTYCVYNRTGTDSGVIEYVTILRENVDVALSVHAFEQLYYTATMRIQISSGFNVASEDLFSFDFDKVTVGDYLNALCENG